MNEMREKMKGRKFKIGCLPAIFANKELNSTNNTEERRNESQLV